MNLSDLLIYGDIFGGGTGGQSSGKSFIIVAPSKNSDWSQYPTFDTGETTLVRVADYMTIDELDPFFVVSPDLYDSVQLFVATKANMNLQEVEVIDGEFTPVILGDGGVSVGMSVSEDVGQVFGVPSGLYLDGREFSTMGHVVIAGHDVNILPESTEAP